MSNFGALGQLLAVCEDSNRSRKLHENPNAPDFCTRVKTGTNYSLQSYYICYTCSPANKDNIAICITCADEHRNLGHTLSADPVYGNGYCDCKDFLPKFGKCCQKLACTFLITGAKHNNYLDFSGKQMTQLWYNCNTCAPGKSTIGFCEHCLPCHEGHDVVKREASANFYCDCGDNYYDQPCSMLVSGKNRKTGASSSNVVDVVNIIGQVEADKQVLISFSKTGFGHFMMSPINIYNCFELCTAVYPEVKDVVMDFIETPYMYKECNMLKIASGIFGVSVNFNNKLITFPSMQTEQKTAEIINQFCYENTDGMITDVVKEEDVVTSPTVLVSCLYFKGVFKNPFDPKKTKSWGFIGLKGIKKVDMMHYDGNSFGPKHNFMKSKHFSSLILEYKDDTRTVGDSRFTCVLTLPLDSSLPLSKVFEDSSLMTEFQLHSNMNLPVIKDSDVDLKVPKFKMQKRFDNVLDIMKGTSFDVDKFMTLTKIDTVVHVVSVNFDEVGTTGSAVTCFTTRGMCTKRVWHGDRPFIVTVFDHQTKTVLFTGPIDFTIDV